MTDPIEPIRAPGDRRQTIRRHTDPPTGAPTFKAQLPVAVVPEEPEDPQPMVVAQILGQDGQKRGLRGGPETLAKAKAAYLNAEWSGPTDRRTRTGIISKAKI